MPSKTRRMFPIYLSHTPPKCDACGGLNSHLHPCSMTNRRTFPRSISLKASSNSDFPSMKFVPRSHRNIAAWPRSAKKRLRAQTKALVSMDSNNSMCIALLARPQQNAIKTMDSLRTVVRQSSVCLEKWQGHSPVWSTVFVDLFLLYLQKSPVFDGKADLIIKRG